MPVTTPTAPHRTPPGNGRGVPPQSDPAATAELVGGILSDAQELVSQQLELFKVEVQDDVRRSMRATALIGAGLGFLMNAIVFLGLTLAYLLHEGAGWSLAASMGLTTLVVVLLGGGLVAVGVWLFRSFNPLPDETAAALQENVEWLQQKS
jgi:uncharacterized membrane protein YqjE